MTPRLIYIECYLALFILNACPQKVHHLPMDVRPRVVSTTVLRHVRAFGLTAATSPVYVATDNGLYRSVSPPYVSWTKVNDMRSITSISPDPRHPSTIVFAPSDGIYVYRSTDAGRTWVRVADCAAQDIARAPSNPDVLYATGSVCRHESLPQGEEEERILTSRDGGRHWETVSDWKGSSAGGPSYLDHIAVDPRDATHVVVADHEYNYESVMASRDSGRHWRRIMDPPYDLALLADVRFGPRQSNLWVAWDEDDPDTNGGEIDENGRRVHVWPHNVVTLSPTAIAFDPRTARLYVRLSIFNGSRHTVTFVTAVSHSGARTMSTLPRDRRSGGQMLAITASGYLLTGDQQSALAVTPITGN